MRFKQLFISVFMVLPVMCWGNVGPVGFHAFNQNRVFVETGTFGGNGVRLALEAGFEEVHSCDIDLMMVQDAKSRFSGDARVHIYQKDSSYQLWDIIKNIHESMTFWLDAHNGFPDPDAVGVKNTPLMEELDQIKEHPIKSHIILIDDLHCCGTLLFDYLTLEDIIEKVLEVNPEYIITFVAGGDDGEYPNNILAAFPPEN